MDVIKWKCKHKSVKKNKEAVRVRSIQIHFLKKATDQSLWSKIKFAEEKNGIDVKILSRHSLKNGISNWMLRNKCWFVHFSHLNLRRINNLFEIA